MLVPQPGFVQPYSAAIRLFERELVRDGGSTQATIHLAHKCSPQHKLTQTFKDLLFEDFIHWTVLGSLLHREV